MTDLSKRVETDVNVYRLRLAALPGGVVAFGWDYPGSTLLRVRIARAPAGDDESAANAAGRPVVARPSVEPPDGGDWRVVYDAETGSFRDRDLPAGSRWRYAVYARDGDGPWTLWRDEVVVVP